MFDSFKIQNVSNFYFEERAAKFLIFLKGHYFEYWRVLIDFYRLFKKFSQTWAKIQQLLKIDRLL